MAQTLEIEATTAEEVAPIIKAGLWITANYKSIVICTCGNYRENVGRYYMSCPTCGNTHYKEIQSLNRDRTVTLGYELHVIDKNDYSFHVKKIEYATKISKNIKKIDEINIGKSYELKYSLKDQTMTLLKNGSEVETSERSLQNFFKDIFTSSTHNKVYDVIKKIATDKNYNLYKFSYDHLSKKREERSYQIGRGLQRLFKYPVLEIMNNCGFGNDLYHIYGSYKYSQETQPHKILGVPKYLVHIIKDCGLKRHTINALTKMDEKFGGNNVKIIVQLFKEESNVNQISNCANYLTELYEKYGYKDVRKLCMYVTRSVKLEQGIDRPGDALTYLRDYVRMCTNINVKFDKYPKSLKKEHDITLLNYSVRKSEIKNTQFKEVVAQEDYTKLEYKYKDYCIVIPQSPADLVAEGSSLSHCVASYVDDIIKGKCKIIFLRKTEFPKEALVTIEIRDNKYIRQVRGFDNRKPFDNEMDFVEKWAEKRELTLHLY